MDCNDCDADIPDHVDRCVACGSDVGYPNVRAAQHPEELAALRRRVDIAETNAATRGHEHVVKEFRLAVRGSRAVMCCRLGILDNVVSSDNGLFSTYYQLVDAEARIPEHNAYDEGRQAVDATLFPKYHEHIRFAALSLDGRGLTNYGPYSVAFRDQMIEKRASVFEGNSFLELQRQRVIVGTPVPRGLRATWERRDDLAVAKLAAKLDGSTQPSDFPKVLLRTSADCSQDEFIEVHIYGPLHRRSIEKVRGRKPKRKQDRVLVENLRENLRQVKVELELDP